MLKIWRSLTILVALAVGSSLWAAPAQAQSKGTAAAIFAGGCFWCTEHDFDHIAGVVSTTSGYSGGHVVRPSYAQVSSGKTGHVEAVRVVYDPARISYETLVSRFFRSIDPSDAGGQFCDRGAPYRATIFVANKAERRAAEAALQRASLTLKRPIATQIQAAAAFYPAEASHQDYWKRNPVRYRFYRYSCGRDKRLKQIWGR
jgi:peptide-methionine (S)-S-oxide reductase